MEQLDCSTLRLIDFPSELLEHILREPVLDYRDICHLSAVSTKLNDICNSNDVWKAKFMSRWPRLNGNCPWGKQTSNWKREFISRHHCGCAVRQFVDSLSPQFYSRDDISRQTYEQFHRGLHEHEHSTVYAIDELKHIIGKGKEHQHLTEKYYGKKALTFFQQKLLHNEWLQLLQKPPEEQLLETGASFIAQWFQPDQDTSAEQVSVQLDVFADDVRQGLFLRHPQHPACQRSPHQNKLTDAQGSLWSPQQCRQVLEMLNHVLFEKHGFEGDQKSYYDPTNSFINKVLQNKKGIPITLSVLYISLARRLGVFCEPVNFPIHFLVRWKEHPELSDPLQYTYIDAFNKGSFLSHFECRQLLSGLHTPDAQCYQTVPPLQVFQRMCHNLFNIGERMADMGNIGCLLGTLELLLILSPKEPELLIPLAQLYVQRGINLMEVVDMLQEVTDTVTVVSPGMIACLTERAQAMIEKERNQEKAEIVAKRRSENREVKFSVGMIMKHKRYNYYCVIYGWDRQCEASQAWIYHMGVHLLPKKQHQPFYNVLVADGSNRYAAQESLEISPHLQTISHPEVGKYFTEFKDNHYHPNQEKAQEYPDDLEVTKDFVKDKYG